MRARLLSGKHSRFEDGAQAIYRAGDVFEIHPDEAAFLGSRVEILGPKAEAPAPSDSGPDDDAPPADAHELAENPVEAALSGTWSAAAKIIRESDDPDFVEALGIAEEAGKARASVLSAARERLEELLLQNHED